MQREPLAEAKVWKWRPEFDAVVELCFIYLFIFNGRFHLNWKKTSSRHSFVVVLLEKL